MSHYERISLGKEQVPVWPSVTISTSQSAKLPGVELRIGVGTAFVMTELTPDEAEHVASSLTAAAAERRRMEAAGETGWASEAQATEGGAR